MRGGRLRHRIDLYKPATQTANALGETRAEPTRVLSESSGGGWWASITPVSGSESDSARQTQGVVTHEIRMRWNPVLNIGPAWSATYNARRFEFVSVVNADEMNKETLIAAREMVGQFPNP